MNLERWAIDLVAHTCHSSLTEKRLMELANSTDPKFSEAGKCHDWRNYVPTVIQRNWTELPLITKMCIVTMAEDSAAHEEWE